MKILHTEWSDGWGGQEMRIINEMIAVREKGVEVCLACRDNAKIKQKALENKIEVFTFAFDGAYDLKTVFALNKIIKKESVDIVNTHSGKDTWVGGFAAKLAGVKFIRTRHLSNKINPSRLNFINEMADFIITTGETVRKDMIKYNRIKSDKILSIPTGIDAEIFDPKKYDKDECRKLFNFKNDKFYIGILAILRSFKRHDFFLDIANHFKTFKDFEFVIAGDGPKRDEIEEKINRLGLKNVKMLGHISNTAEFLKAVDLQLLTSDSNEGVPQSIIQGLMMQKDIIATNVGSIKDLYKNNNFLILEDLNINKWTNGIENIFKKELILNKDRDYMVNNFSKDAMTNKTLEIYNKVLNENTAC